MGIGEVRIHLQRFLQLLNGGVILPCIGQDLTEVALVLQIQGIEFDRAAQMGERFRVTRLPREEEPVPVMGVGEVRVEFEGPLEIRLPRAEKSNRLQRAPPRAAWASAEEGSIDRAFSAAAFALGAATLSGIGL